MYPLDAWMTPSGHEYAIGDKVRVVQGPSRGTVGRVLSTKASGMTVSKTDVEEITDKADWCFVYYDEVVCVSET